MSVKRRVSSGNGFEYLESGEDPGSIMRENKVSTYDGQMHAKLLVIDDWDPGHFADRRFGLRKH